MTPGAIVAVDSREDAIPRSLEPNKRRPAVVIATPLFFDGDFPLQIVVPLTTREALNVLDATMRIDPTPENGCIATSYALAWNVQTVPYARIAPTPSRVTSEQLAHLRRLVARCIDLEVD
jgi:mRNA interferase MazF